jgi:Protein of unknown function (DUF1588)/Protein of unknown function (DUF1592)/Protein of unknown function (DUF1595)/Protein of unknown function (DUF1585)
MTRLPVCLGGLLLVLGACSPGATAPEGSSGGSPHGGGAATAGSGGNAPGSAGMAGAGVTPTDCTSPRAAAVHLTALTESQFNNSVLDVLQVSGNLLKGLGQGFDDVSLEQRAAIAATIAGQAAAGLAKWAPCAPPATGASTDCERQIIDEVGRRLYRRPLSDVERSDMTKLFDAGLKEKDFSTGVEWFLTGLLQSPYFVYQVVRPDAAERIGEVRALTSYEYASRLAHFLWDGPPDDALLAAAESDGLKDDVRRDEQIARMMKDARFTRGLTQFYSRWLNLNAFRELARDVPELTESVAADLATSLLMTATEPYKLDAPNISALFSGDSYYLNDGLRRFYGLASAGGGSGFTPTPMTGQGRRGLLTHPALMALLARPEESFPIGRGLFLLRNVVCQVVPAPPPGLVIPQQPPLKEGVSTRERLEAHTADPVCQSCHRMINPAGFALESYDEVGRYRAMDHGRPVDTSGTLQLGKDIDGDFATGDELIARLAESQAVRACFAEKYLNFALSHPVTDPADACSLGALGKTFGSSGDLKQLALSVSASDSFRMRLAEGVGP